jgi:hypothetical protein
VWVHGLLVSERPCISVPMFIILSISVAISNPLSMLDPLMFWNPNLVYPLLSCSSQSGSPASDMFVLWFCGCGFYRLSFVCCHLRHDISCYVYVYLLLGMSLVVGLFTVRQIGAAPLQEWWQQLLAPRSWGVLFSLLWQSSSHQLHYVPLIL